MTCHVLRDKPLWDGAESEDQSSDVQMSHRLAGPESFCSGEMQRVIS
jgi:hypothetical protein